MFKNVRIETDRLILRPFRPEDTSAFHEILSQEEVMHYLPESVMTLDEVRHIVDWYQMCYEKNTPENIIKWTLAVWLKCAVRSQPPDRGQDLTEHEGLGSRLRGNDGEKGNDLEGGDAQENVDSAPLSAGCGHIRRNDGPAGAERIIGWAGVGPLEFDETETEIFYGLASKHWGKGYATEAARAVLDYAFKTIGLKRLVGVANPQNAASVKVLEKIGMTFVKKLVGLPEKFANDEGSYFYVREAQASGTSRNS